MTLDVRTPPRAPSTPSFLSSQNPVAGVASEISSRSRATSETHPDPRYENLVPGCVMRPAARIRGVRPAGRAIGCRRREGSPNRAPCADPRRVGRILRSRDAMPAGIPSSRRASSWPRRATPPATRHNNDGCGPLAAQGNHGGCPHGERQLERYGQAPGGPEAKVTSRPGTRPTTPAEARDWGRQRHDQSAHISGTALSLG
jgi:hypothetical protein